MVTVSSGHVGTGLGQISRCTRGSNLRHHAVVAQVYYRFRDGDLDLEGIAGAVTLASRCGTRTSEGRLYRRPHFACAGRTEHTRLTAIRPRNLRARGRWQLTFSSSERLENRYVDLTETGQGTEHGRN